MRKIAIILGAALLLTTAIKANSLNDTTFIAKTKTNCAYIINNSLEVYATNGTLLKYNQADNNFSLYDTKNDIERKKDKAKSDLTKTDRLIKFLISNTDNNLLNKYPGLSKYNCNDIELFRILIDVESKYSESNYLTKKSKLEGGKTYLRTTEGENKLTYHLYVPTAYKRSKAKKTPLIVLFSPAGNGKGMMTNIIKAAEESNSLLIGCDYLRNGISDQNQETKMEDEILNDIFNLVKYNKDRLIYSGFSGGAMRAYGLSVRREESIYGIFAMGGWLGGPNYQDEAYPAKMRIAMSNGDNDKGANGWQSIDTKTLEKCGSTVKSFPFKGNHQSAPKETAIKAIEWILSNN